MLVTTHHKPGRSSATLFQICNLTPPPKPSGGAVVEHAHARRLAYFNHHVAHRLHFVDGGASVESPPLGGP